MAKPDQFENLNNTRILLERAANFYRADRLTEAAKLYSQITRNAPEYVAATYQLAMIDLKLGRLDRSIERFKLVIELDPQSFIAYYNLGFAYQQLGRWQDASEAYEKALALQPADVPTQFSLAAAFAFLGRLADAVKCYRALMRSSDNRLQALIRLAVLDPSEISAEELTTMQRATAINLEANQRIALHFALGEVLEYSQQFDRAFDAFATGNELKRKTLVGSENPETIARDHSQLIAAIKRQFNADFIAHHMQDGNKSTAPIFIVGMPRSGSTLIEQFLSSHPGVQGFGEHPALVQVIGAAYPYDPRAQKLSNHFTSLADQYLDAMQAFGWNHSSRLVDKMLDNYLHIGMIHLMFPNAVILHSVRNAMDTCFACFRQLFTGAGNETTYDLRDIAAEYLRYRDMMTHWETVLPGRVINVEYEMLINDPADQIRRLVSESCGLSWNEACLDFFNARQPVRTASATQVRKPIFTSSMRRWRKYENYLQPLIDALGNYANESRADRNL